MAAFGTRWALMCSHLFQVPTLEFGTVLACSRLRDSGEKSFSKKKCEKRAGAGESGHWAIRVHKAFVSSGTATRR